jgi:hypothetical protein
MPGQAIAEAFVDINARTTNLDRGLNSVKTQLNSLSSAGASLGSSLVKAFGAAAIAASAIKFTNFSINKFIEGEEAVAKLDAVLKATGGAAKLSSKELQDFASQLQKTSRYADDAIVNTQALLLTFKSIKGDQFKEATKAILDMSTVMGQDLKSSAIQVGKALNDPIQGVSALARVGVQFTDVQKNMIKSLQGSGDLIGAQGIILDELKSQFGGAAEAAKNTLGGAFAGLKNNFGDLAEGIGKGIVNFTGLEGVINKLSDAIGKFNEEQNKVNEGEAPSWLDYWKSAFDEFGKLVQEKREKIYKELTTGMIIGSAWLVAQLKNTRGLGKALTVKTAIGAAAIEAQNAFQSMLDKMDEHTKKSLERGKKMFQDFKDQWISSWITIKMGTPKIGEFNFLGTGYANRKMFEEKKKELTMTEKLAKAEKVFGDAINKSTGDLVAQGHAIQNLMGIVTGTGFENLQSMAQEQMFGVKPPIAGGLPTVEEWAAEQKKLDIWQKEDDELKKIAQYLMHIEQNTAQESNMLFN